MLVFADLARDLDEARAKLVHAVESGAALQKMRDWIAAQGGDPRVVDDASRLPHSAFTREVAASEAGWLARYDAEGVGRAAMALGAGRARVDDAVDPAAGLVLHAKVGDRVEAGQSLCTLHASSEALLDAGEGRLRNAVAVFPEAVGMPDLVIEQ
jgi:thymidine phosphorylase